MFPIIEIKKENDIYTFIETWSKLYYYRLEKQYSETINKPCFEVNDIQNLFIWKNGMKLSKKKQVSLNLKITSRLSLINSYKSNNKWTLDEFQNNFGDLSAVWKIFLLHLINPNYYPIYDQNTHRAYNCIHNLPFEKVTARISNRDKEHFYFKIYLPYIEKFKNYNLKKIDEAFFAFGKFINTSNYKFLFNN